jgi:glycosyltransferase involved in cell wall biosynthesis
MRIGVDAREIQNGVITGIGRSLANFIRYFSKNEKKHELILFAEKELPHDLNGNIRQVSIDRLPTLVWDQVRLPQALKASEIDLFYSPYYKVPLLTDISVVNQILDLMFLEFPPYRDAIGLSGRFYYNVFGRAFAKKSINIITDSEHAKQDIVKNWNIDPEKIEVIPLGIGNRYKPVNDSDLINKVKSNFRLPDKFILYLGNFKPHKNVSSLVKAFKTLGNRFLDFKLVLAGPIDEHGERIKNLVSEMGLEERVVFTDTVKESDLPEALISSAEIFVFPSLYEGFGLPPLEAMACGTPVIASNLTSVPEVVGDAGILVNPLDVESMGKAIAELIENPDKRKFLVEKGLERSRCFNEKNTAGKLFEHIISLMEKIE